MKLVRVLLDDVIVNFEQSEPGVFSSEIIDEKRTYDDDYESIRLRLVDDAVVISLFFYDSPPELDLHLVSAQDLMLCETDPTSFRWGNFMVRIIEVFAQAHGIYKLKLEDHSYIDFKNTMRLSMRYVRFLQNKSGYYESMGFVPTRKGDDKQIVKSLHQAYKSVDYEPQRPIQCLETLSEQDIEHVQEGSEMYERFAFENNVMETPMTKTLSPPSVLERIWIDDDTLLVIGDALDAVTKAKVLGLFR